MSNNICSKTHTHFLRGVELIKEYEEENSICSENWAYPIESFGDPTDKYYAEIWHDGMDWTHNYWIIETINFDTPKAKLIIHMDVQQRDKLNEHDFNELLQAIMWWRRSCLLFRKNDKDPFFDNPWCYIKTLNESDSDKLLTDNHGLVCSTYSHASQPSVIFYIDKDSSASIGDCKNE